MGKSFFKAVGLGYLMYLGTCLMTGIVYVISPNLYTNTLPFLFHEGKSVAMMSLLFLFLLWPFYSFFIFLYLLRTKKNVYSDPCSIRADVDPNTTIIFTFSNSVCFLGISLTNNLDYYEVMSQGKNYVYDARHEFKTLSNN